MDSLLEKVMAAMKGVDLRDVADRLEKIKRKVTADVMRREDKLEQELSSSDSE